MLKRQPVSKKLDLYGFAIMLWVRICDRDASKFAEYSQINHAVSLILRCKCAVPHKSRVQDSLGYHHC